MEKTKNIRNRRKTKILKYRCDIGKTTVGSKIFAVDHINGHVRNARFMDTCYLVLVAIAFLSLNFNNGKVNR